MNIEEFTRILTTFADNPACVDVSKGQLMVQIRDDVIQAEVFTKGGLLVVKEDDTEWSADKWVIERIARLPLLPDRILSYVQDDTEVDEKSMFVTPSGELLDQLGLSDSDENKHVDDTVESIKCILGRQPAGTSSVLYLTSDAGEGKTTLINQIARMQAADYKDKKTDWLLMPITLGGKPFLRFDEIIVASLMNRLRFPFFFYDSFIELVRLGVLVPAFDGFEEMLIESSSGEALSALGNLLETLKSSGTILVSARKAFFDYKSFADLANQARLFDAIKTDAASFSSLAINRWSFDQFIAYCKKRGVEDGKEIYDSVSARFKDTEHPLLTRAVLVRRLIDVASDKDERETLLLRLGQEGTNYFFEFVNAIVEREAAEKWIDRSGEPHIPLLTVAEHHELLSLIAQEMWLVNSSEIKDEALDVWTDLFSEIKRKSPQIATQVKDRIKQHALLTTVNASGTLFAFDHEEFRDFFLGQAIGRRVIENNKADLRNVLKIGALTRQAFRAGIEYLAQNNFDFAKAVELFQAIGEADLISSFSRENCGGFVIRLLNGKEWKSISVSNLTFPINALANRHLNGISFTKCYFHSSDLDNSMIENCVFENCRFDRLELASTTTISNAEFDDCELVSVVPADQVNRVFAPTSIQSILLRAGFGFKNSSQRPEQEQIYKPDFGMQIFDRILRYFLRSTNVSENVFRRNLGVNAGNFFKDILPALLKHNVLIESDSGPGKQGHFRLNIQMRDIEDAVKNCDGSFDAFLAYIDTNVKRATTT